MQFTATRTKIAEEEARGKRRRRKAVPLQISDQSSVTLQLRAEREARRKGD